VKFACDSCGRGYAVADELRGRAFKMKCKACGHLIVVRGAAAPGAHGTAPPAQEERPLAAPPASAPAPGVAPAEEPPATPPDVNPFVVAPVSAAAVAAAVEALRATPLSREPESEPVAPGTSVPNAPSEGGGYVDLVLDEGTPAGREAEAAIAAPPPVAPAATAAGGFEDPFEGWKPFEGEDLAKAKPPPLPRPGAAKPGARPEPPAKGLAAAPVTPARSRPSVVPKVAPGPKVFLIGVVAAVVVIAVVVLATGRSGGKGEQAAPRAAPSAPAAPARPIEVAAPAPPAPVPSQAGPASPEPAPPAATRAERDAAAEERAKRRDSEGRPRRERPARAAREERETAPEQAPPTPALAPSEPAAEAAPATANAPPSSDQIARIVSANRKAFESCVADAIRRDPGLELTGREVVLVLTVNPTGRVADPTLDDVELDKTDLGACLRSAARLIVFPPFEGSPMKVEVPLTLGRGG